MRGIGVAVITSWCGTDVAVGALVAQRQPLVHAEAVLLVDDDQAELRERDALLHQRVRADDDVRAARAARASALARALPVHLAGQPCDLAGRAARASARKLRRCCSASSSVGAISATW